MPADYGQRLTPVCERLAREERRPAVREVVPVRWPAARPNIRPTGARKGQGFSFALWQRMLFSCLVDADFLDTEAFMQGPQPRGRGEDVQTLRARLDAYMERFSHPKSSIDEKRCAILADCRRAAEGPQGLYTLTVPTGGGKTLASLAFALRHAEKHGLRCVIYVIPYTSIIGQTAKKFREALGEENVLEHTSIAEAGVDVDFPRVCREAAGLDSVIQAAGRCNREGGHSAQESVVTVFHSGEKWRDKVPKALKRPADVAAEILETEADIASPEAVGRYFTQLYALTGNGLDAKGIEKMLDDGGSAPPFEEAARAFRLIEEGTRAVLIPTTKEARTCAERLGAGERSRELWRQAARCSVSVYEGDFQALLAAGKLDVLDEQIAVLLDAACYDPDKGLCVPGMGAGIMI